MGWCYYAADNLVFPFNARCSAKRASSPLKVGKLVQVIGMADEDDCAHELMVAILWQGEKLAVPLCQLEASTESNGLTRQVLGDWHYWVARGYGF